MNADLERLFHLVADLPPDKRLRYFEEHHVDTAMRTEIEDLIAFDGREDGLTSAISAALTDLDPHAGREVGQFRLLRAVGRGGMGSVYLAERAAGDGPRQAAIKLLRLDASHPAQRDRFRRERQFLGALHHPNIARLLDAGHDADGHPFLAMEFVDGVRIDEWASGRPPRAIVEVFLRVCAAVEHAHASLIIHRDLKPSNILVDTRGEPRLLDFGIARFLDEVDDVTRTAVPLLSPGYASPEQWQGLAYTTATDVYSLGAVLYRLLAGRPPHSSTSASAPSTGVAGPITRPTELNAAVPRDLEAIVLKCLRPEPSERYPSVESLSADLRAWLESRPVSARAGDTWYRTRKFARRHWAPITAATAIAATLLISLWIVNRERAASDRRFRTARAMIARYLELDKQLTPLTGATKVREALVGMSVDYLEELRKDRSGDDELAFDLAGNYRAVAQIQGLPANPNLGHSGDAQKNLAIASEILEPLLAAKPSDRRLIVASAGILHDRMILAETARHDGEAEKLAAAVISRLERLDNPTQEEMALSARYYANLSITLSNVNRTRDSLVYSARSVELLRKLPENPERLANYLGGHALRLSLAGQFDQAVEVLLEARAALDRVKPSESWSPDLTRANTLMRLGTVLARSDFGLGRREEGVAALREVVAICRRRIAAEPENTLFRTRLNQAATEIAEILQEPDPRASLEASGIALDSIGGLSAYSKRRRDVIRTLSGRTYALRALGRLPEAEAELAKAMELVREEGQWPAETLDTGSEAYRVLSAQADLWAATGRLPQAIGCAEDTLRRLHANPANKSGDLRRVNTIARHYARLQGFYEKAGNSAKAAAARQQALELWQEADRRTPDNPFVARQLAAYRP